MGFFDKLGEAVGNSMNDIRKYSEWLDEQPDERLIRAVKYANGTKRIMIINKLKERGYGPEILEK